MSKNFIPKNILEEALPYTRAMKGVDWTMGHVLNWEAAATQKKQTVKYKMEDTISMYGKSIKCSPAYIYLGTYCNSRNRSNIVSGYHTMRRFKTRMISKQQFAVHGMGIDYWKLPTMIQLRFIATFYNAYTHTYAQVLPTEMIQEMDNAQFKSTMHMLGIKTYRVDKAAFHLWTGISSTRDKYNAAKTKFLHKIHSYSGKYKHHLHKGFEDKTLTSYRPYQELDEARQILMPRVPVDIFKKMPKKELKHYLDKAQIQHQIKQLHKYHPFKITKWKPKKFTPYQILDFATCEHKLRPLFKLVTKDATMFNELFYRFSVWDHDKNTKHDKFGRRQCKLCNKFTELPLKMHTATVCQALKPYRRAFCQNMHTTLGKIYKKGIWVHQQQYAQEVLHTLQNFTTSQYPTMKDNQSFWKMICGADHVRVTRDHKNGVTRRDLRYSGQTAKRNDQRLFWEATRAWCGKYLHAIERCWKAKNPRNNIKNKWKQWQFEPGKRGTNFNHRRLHWNCQNNEEFTRIMTDNDINENNTIIIATDGSRSSKQGREHAGLGIVIKFKGETYALAQGIGRQGILHAELRALVIAFKFMQWLKLPLKTTPVCIITDSRICFEYYFGNKKNHNNIPYPNLTREFHTLAHNHDVCLIKVPSHEDQHGRTTIEYNDEADKYAEIGRKTSENLNQFKVPEHYLGRYKNIDIPDLNNTPNQDLRYDSVTSVWLHGQIVTLPVVNNQKGGTMD